MDADAPEVSNSAWGHKYFSLMYPDKLDDFHAEEFQRFHIGRRLHTDRPAPEALAASF
jgi:5-methylcytosine-specific restriction protein B